jgi:hypothetical protein
MLLKRKKKEKRVGACAHESYGRLLLSYVIIYSSKGPMTIQFGTYLIFVSKQNVSNDSNKFEKKKKFSSVSGSKLTVKARRGDFVPWRNFLIWTFFLGGVFRFVIFRGWTC